MGLFSAIGGLFGGGGSSSSTQTTTTTTTVDVSNEIANIIDLTSVADAVNKIGETLNTTISTTSEGTNKLLQSIAQEVGISLDISNRNQKAALLTAIAGVQTEQEKAALEKKIFNIVKIAALGGAAFYVWKRYV